MIKVKEWLDKHFYQFDECTSELKSNGHHCVNGTWEYPKGIIIGDAYRLKEFENLSDWKPKDQLSVTINNETLVIRMFIINGKSVSKYGYLQTYEHIPRGLPDVYGYYRRCTDEEIIKQW